MRTVDFGRWLTAGASLALAGVTLAWRDFGLQWQPVPDGTPKALALASGALLLAAGASLLVPRLWKAAALALAAYWLAFAVLHTPPVAAHPTSVGAWLGPAENLAIALGAAGLAVGRPAPVRFAYAACLMVFGLSHFVYLKITADMVPGWLPLHREVALVTGAGHLLAGVSLALGFRPRLILALEAAMMGLITLGVSGTALLADPTSRLAWTAGAVSLWLTASAAALSGPPRPRSSA